MDWREFIVTPDGMYGVGLACRGSGYDCDWTWIHPDGYRYFMLGEAVEAAKEHLDWHGAQLI